MCRAHLGVVRVGVRLRELVVGPVVAGPGVDGVLPRHRVGRHQQQPQRQPRLVGAVRPQPVRPRRDAHTCRYEHFTVPGKGPY